MKNETITTCTADIPPVSTAEALVLLVEKKHGYNLKGLDLENATFDAFILCSGKDVHARKIVFCDFEIDSISDAITAYANKNGR